MISTQPLFDARRMDYELPRGGISLAEYVARRLHKTSLLAPLATMLPKNSANALAQLALYAIAGSTSFGAAKYQPRSNRRGEKFETRDPDTNARVQVVYEGETTFSYEIKMRSIGQLRGTEQILGTTVGLRGLGMPAPSTFNFEASDGSYTAKLQGIITSELVPGFLGWRVRGYGDLQLKDNQGNHGTLKLERSGDVTIEITTSHGKRSTRREKLVA